jgi:hypothetical protein
MLGYDLDSFWDQTPRTLSLAFAAYDETQVNDYNGRAWLAWHMAALSRSKKLPPLRNLMSKVTTPKSAMEEQIAGLVRWVRATGGRIIYNG